MIPNFSVKKTLLIIFSIFPLLLAQSIDKQVASVGKEKISSNEFKVRYELMPHLSPYQNSDSIKKEFLYSLIAEKLWAKEAISKGYDTSAVVTNLMKPLKKMYMRDALFQKEIGKYVKISDSELAKGIWESSLTLNVDVISSVDSAAMQKLYSKIKSGESYDSLYTLLPDESTNNKKPLAINFGDLENTTIENILFSMKLGEVSKPLENGNVWFLFKLESTTKKDINGKTADQIKMQAKDIIRGREAREIGSKYLSKILSGVTIKANTPLFITLASAMNKVFNQKKTKHMEAKNGKIYLQEKDINKVISIVGPDSAKMNIADFENDSPTLTDFLYDLNLNSFYVLDSDLDKVEGKLSAVLKKYIRQELITREAYKQGLDKLPSVKKSLDEWKENTLAQIMRNQFIDSASVSDAQAILYYNNEEKNSAPVTKVNILEILNKNLDVISLVLEDLKKGADFRELAKTYTQREWTKEKGGEFGYFPITSYGEIGKAASKMKVGEVYGPIKVPEGFSVIKLIDKKEVSKDSVKSFAEVKDKIKDQLFYRNLKFYFDKYTAKFAQKFGVKINQGILNSIKVTEINMFTHKLMGFGGRIAAVPYTFPSYDWFNIWQNEKKQLP